MKRRQLLREFVPLEAPEATRDRETLTLTAKSQHVDIPEFLLMVHFNIT